MATFLRPFPTIAGLITCFFSISAHLIASPSVVEYPATMLRGYGTVTATCTSDEINGQKTSTLRVVCESGEKARLLQAKYLSDLQLLPGVARTDDNVGEWRVGSLKFWGVPVSVHAVKDRGFIAAVREGATVWIVASPTREGLVNQIQKDLARNLKKATSEAEGSVPMWLDRWDKYGFRFYYGTGMIPPGATNDTYDFRGDFTFAKNCGAGMIFWNPLNHYMGADGQTDMSTWDWALAWAKQDNLPVAINLSTGNFDIPLWLANRHRGGMMTPMPDYLGDSMFVAGARGTSGKVGELAWGATPARDAMLAAIQGTVRRLVNEPNIVSWLEPHGELYQGGDDFMGYGQASDATFREYIRGKYGSLDKVSQAWFGNSTTVKSWDDVKAPELASFAGWGRDALDLAGTWRVAYPDSVSPAEWFTPTFDDSAWLNVIAPGDDRNLYLPKKAAVYRRTFDLPADWQAKHSRTWIYLWDLNLNRSEKQLPVAIYLNGQKAGESPCDGASIHWMTSEVTPALRAGANQLTLTLPLGNIGYRIYLSPVEPRQYPNLGECLNTQWMDLVGWRLFVRGEAVRRGMEMIREVDPNRPITLMAPGLALDNIKSLAQQYGGEFHDTGFMSGCWADLLPSLMRGADLPFSLEPGNGPPNVPEFKRFTSYWLTEGNQSADYFIHVGDVLWHPDIRKTFEEYLPMLRLIGKCHVPKADVAWLWSTSTGVLTGFPWTNDVNTNLPSGWLCHGTFEEMLQYCPRDAVTDSDFVRGNASKYKVIIDTNTSIMDEPMIDQIEKYVKDGGTFVTFIQTGRHSPTKPNSWPISRLTGYDILTVEKFDAKGNCMNFDPKDPNPAGSRGQPLLPAPGQQIYLTREDWMKVPWNTGLRMKKKAQDARDLVLWEDGTVAIGMRKLGKGAIVAFGCKNNGQSGNMTIPAFEPLLTMAGVKTNTVTPQFDKPLRFLQHYLFREFISNNGLYDISVLTNNDTATPIKASLVFKDQKPEFARDVQTGQELPISNGKLAEVTLDPLQTRIFLTPRDNITQAPSDWFNLQRNWWKASTPVTKPFPKASEQFVRTMDDNWAWHAVEEKEAPAPWVTPAFDDSQWTRMELGTWTSAPERKAIRHGLFRRSFSVPGEWNKGRVELWILNDLTQRGRIWLDGTLVVPWGAEAHVSGMDYNGTFVPGTRHTVAIEIESKSQIAGMCGDMWLKYVPTPESIVDLAGEWTVCKEDLRHDTGKVTLPGPYKAFSIWREITVPKEREGRTVMLSQQADRPFQAFVNGTAVQYSGRPAANASFGMNITPWIRFGQVNRIQLVSTYGQGEMHRIGLDFYQPGTYP